MISKSQLAIELSRISSFSQPKIKLEQYITDSEIAAEILWQAYLEGDVHGKVIADLGAGTGVFSLGCVLLKAKRIYAVEKDGDALALAKNNINSRICSFVHADVKEFNKKVDTVIQNPPYGTRKRHADREFLIKSFGIADKVYSIHKISTARFIEKITKDYGFRIKKILKFKLPLKKSYPFHTKKTAKIEAGCWILEKQ
ncbi:methyltransferase [Candidatus Woesearchaeota archaeon]|nr:methyltransferase [Candidatus Woesearchaeota archaeon]